MSSSDTFALHEQLWQVLGSAVSHGPSPFLHLEGRFLFLLLIYGLLSLILFLVSIIRFLLWEWLWLRELLILDLVLLDVLLL